MGAVDARAAQEKSASEGVYTAEQANRGVTLYDTSCASCHELGKFKGTEFANVWADKPLTDLHDAVMSMPMDAPGSMKPEEYADILAYFLSINDYPAGETELGRHRRRDQGHQARRQEVAFRSRSRRERDLVGDERAPLVLGSHLEDRAHPVVARGRRAASSRPPTIRSRWA